MVRPLPKVAALVLNWRMAEQTLQCVGDLQATDYDNLTVLVMDNGSGEAQEAQLSDHVSGAELMLLGQNLGYCQAMNRGIAWAEEQAAEFVLFLNNDVRMEPGFLKPLAEVLRNDTTLAAVGPTILDAAGRVWSQGATMRFFPNLSRLEGQGGMPAETSAGPMAVDYLPGACVLYRLADLKAVGGLDESYFMYFEDADLGKRLRDAGRKVLWLPWVRVTHHASSSSGGGRTPLRKYLNAVNSVRYLRAHGGTRLWCAFLLFDCLLWPSALLTSGLRAGWAKFLGVLAGLRGYRAGAADVARWTS